MIAGQPSAGHARRLVILTGASGAGKTTLAEAFSKRCPDLADVYYFDDIGVPSEEERLAKFGRPENWQRAMTFQWMEWIVALPESERAILFEGQMRISFIHAAAEASGIRDYRVRLIDCDDETRQERLVVERRQPEVSNTTMMNWAEYLRGEARQHGIQILDTSNRTIDDCVEALRLRFNP